MESVHGIDVSWIHKPHSKDTPRSVNKQTVTSTTTADPEPPTAQTAAPTSPIPLPSPSPAPAPESEAFPLFKTPEYNAAPAAPAAPVASVAPAAQPSTEPMVTVPKHTGPRPDYQRARSVDVGSTVNGNVIKSGPPSPSPGGRRNSWLSSISSKFSSSPGSPNAAESPPSTKSQPAKSQPAKSSPRKASLPTPQLVLGPRTLNARAAVLAHGVRDPGQGAYTPAPVKPEQKNFLSSALRRLSTSSQGQLSGLSKEAQHGILPRKTMNIDKDRDRCLLPELDQSKLRRVSFCVDVEIASGPRYAEDDSKELAVDNKPKKKLVEKGEGHALKNPKPMIDEKDDEPERKPSVPTVPEEPEPEEPAPKEKDQATAVDSKSDETSEKDPSKKKEKKKRSEEERKARKEKKRKLAEANGILPVELVRNVSDSSLESTPMTSGAATPKTSLAPTTDPVRIYRRCCQLRETPILKKLTEQLGAPANYGVEKPGIVSKLDLSGYWLQLADLITLGDFLAVVPIKEVIMENCGLTDEGVRVLLAGLLAARMPDQFGRRRSKIDPAQADHYPSVVERVVFKNNPKIGREGWRHICLFIHMSRSLKSMDLSMIPFPRPSEPTNSPGSLKRTSTNESLDGDMARILSRSLAQRLGGAEFELLNMAETELDTDQLSALIDGVSKSGLRRLGLAGNNIGAEGMAHVTRFLKQGKCEGLDLGGNDLKDHLGALTEAIDEDHPLWALSLSKCELTPDSLSQLFPALAKLKNFRFIDFSHNHELFESNPSALSILRRYLPKLQILKRIHLTDVSMTPEQAIALAEILPESPSLAHVNILENPKLSALASATDEENQEEACALYASLMAAVRVSKTLVCIDIDVPSAENSEIVKALAKQVVAYSLRNMERGPVKEFSEATGISIEAQNGEDEVAIPEVLLHIVGHGDGPAQGSDDDEPAPDQDYVIGGTGVVKALGICLNTRSSDYSRRPSVDRSGANTPKQQAGVGKAKDMSKNLLGSARKIRARLRPAMLKESHNPDHTNYNKLVFLDATLERMIKRFEDEFPETRVIDSMDIPPMPDISTASPVDSLSTSANEEAELVLPDGPLSDDDETPFTHALSRRDSEALKAQIEEEGRMHRFGQIFRRDILKPESQDHLHGTTGDEEWEPHLVMLRGLIDGLAGDEIKQRVVEFGPESVLNELSEEASALRQKLIATDPEGWRVFKEAQEAAMKNSTVEDRKAGFPPIESEAVKEVAGEAKGA